MGATQRLDIFLVRHGITKWNQDKRYLGHSDESVLPGVFEEMSELKQELNKYSFDTIFTSDLKRCRETSDYLVGNKLNECIVDQRLRELHFGEWEGKTYEELKTNHVYRNWIDDWESYNPPTGETAIQFKSRINEFLGEVYEKAQSKTCNHNQVLVITHGGVIKYILSSLKESSSIWDFKIKHGNGVRISLEYQEGGWLCNSISEVPTPEKE
ncbi:histidine phosphatase family protein [Salipaludibacillus sp. CF4.18]|uniref:histidine phosphatase family protein n=1 Tax=Salipaludibacillus sp. CF4.18 TaxID=3373081 RepID=UPI003EE4CCB1